MYKIEYKFSKSTINPQLFQKYTSSVFRGQMRRVVVDYGVLSKSLHNFCVIVVKSATFKTTTPLFFS